MELHGFLIDQGLFLSSCFTWQRTQKCLRKYGYGGFWAVLTNCSLEGSPWSACSGKFWDVEQGKGRKQLRYKEQLIWLSELYYLSWSDGNVRSQWGWGMWDRFWLQAVPRAVTEPCQWRGSPWAGSIWNILQCQGCFCWLGSALWKSSVGFLVCIEAEFSFLFSEAVQIVLVF